MLSELSVEQSVEQFNLAHQIQSHANKFMQSCHVIAQ